MAVPINPTDEPRLYQQTLLQDGLSDLLENSNLVDCVLKIKGKEFPCHRLVLCACSAYFRGIFLSDLDESKKKEVVLEDVEPGVMGLVLKYLYTSNINVTEQNVQDIFAVANMFQIPSVFTVCVSFLQKRLSFSNCLAIFRLGLMLDCPRLAVSARNYACERFQFISRDLDFLQLGPSELAAILASDALNVETEEMVFESLMKWVAHDAENREKEIPRLLDCVRLRLVSEDYLRDTVEKHKLISSSSSQEVEEMLQMVKDARGGKLPDLKAIKSKAGGADADEASGEEGEEQEEEVLLPGILNDNLRYGMFLRDLMFLVSDTGVMAYDPAGNDCYVASLSTQIPKNHASLVTKENQIFVAGGLFVDELNKEDPLSSYFLQYDPANADWIGMPPIPSPRFLFGMAEAANCIFVVGGKALKDQDQTLDSVMVYDRQTLKWSECEPTPYPVYGHATVSHDDLIYVIGGKEDSKKCLSTMCAYNAKTLEWQDLAPMKCARSLFGATVHGDKIYVAAGVTDTGLTNTVEVYDIADDHEELVPKEMNDIWRFNEDGKWLGILRNMQYATGATILGVRLNTLRLTKM
ncbi:hypothetical protein NHX12_021299 [Muraenolepis orangiensis]|uniref:BTB domain-containing protein n=1 Tax=Muraenolepis orangiensis TaxID=630683 RepID=A0A9Q0ETB3_9TELE|nr:hypothetical protein NHX12_021299 [Muraenolepis orangiensis]